MFKKFREFRWTRPFWGGLLVLIAGVLTFAFPLSPIMTVVHAGLGAIGGILLGLIEIFLGLVILFRPRSKNMAGILAVIIGLVSFPVTNLGGFIVGMLFSVIGGCWAFGWTLPPKTENFLVEDPEPTEVKV